MKTKNAWLGFAIATLTPALVACSDGGDGLSVNLSTNSDDDATDREQHTDPRGEEAGTPSEEAGTQGEEAGTQGDDAGGRVLLTDEQILHVALTANIAEVEQAQVAIERASSSQVQDFAEMMMEAHSTAVKEANTLFADEQVTPADSDTSEMLQAQSGDMVSTLNAAADEAFDLVYMNGQVALHEQVLDILNRQLIPQADNAALDSYLTALQVDVATHLAQAEDLVEQLE